MIILIVVLVLVAVLFVNTYNNLVKAGNNVEEAESTMGVYLKKRRDLIPNIVETVKGYVSHEKETLEEIVKLRNSATGNIDAENQISKGISKIMALAEDYPELKANENFKDLSAQLAKVEEEVAYARKYFNGTVKKYNNLVKSFPTTLIARIFNYHPKEMFEVSSEDKENVEVKF